jgi:UDP-glucose 4-epimerase
VATCPWKWGERVGRICLVTGGAGFIGSNLVRTLGEQGWQVRVLDNLATGRLENLTDVLNHVDFIEADVRDLDAVRRATEGVEVVFHQAALPSVPRSVKDPLATNEVNVTGTLNVLLAARDHRVRRVVVASSSSVYGNTPVLPKSEDLKPSPISPYAVSKLAQELYARSFWELYGLSTVCLRYFNVFGPRQDPRSEYAAVVPRFIGALLSGRSPIIYGDGNQSRDFTYVADVVAANLLAAGAEGVHGEVFNVAGGRETTVNELLAAVQEVVGASVVPEYREPRPGDVRHSRADVSKARRLLGFVPRWDLKAGLRETVRWFEENGMAEVYA